MFTSMLWGRLSDMYGRRPAVLLGLTISVAANLGFGFSRTIGMLMFWRIVAGMANGTVGVMRTMTAEIVKERRHQPRAFLAPPVVFNSGRVIALAVGGCLADPVDNLPYFFGPQGLLNLSKNPAGVSWALEFPYALPALFNGIVLAICLVAAAFWLHESLPNKPNHPYLDLVAFKDVLLNCVKGVAIRRQVNDYAMIRANDTDTVTCEMSSKTMSTKAYPKLRNILTLQLCRVLFAFTLLPLHNATFLHVFPVLLSMPSSPHQQPHVFFFKGGLGLSSPAVGLYLAIVGITGIVLQLFIYPRIQHSIGTLSVFRVASAIFPIIYILAPYLALFVDHKSVQWTVMTAVLFSQVVARTMAIPSSILLLTAAAPHRSVMGTVHGAGNTMSALASACGPVIGGMLLAKGIDIGVVGLVWWAWLCLVAIASLAWSFALDKTMESKSGLCNET
jgi:MFS family permease